MGVKSQKFSSYSSIKNYAIDPKLVSKYLIAEFKTNVEMTCQTTCNLNSLCLCLFYNMINGTCSLYSKIFPLSQFIEYSKTDFYVKNS